VTPEEVELLSQLTIIIPTYNRPLTLERSIEYWRDTPVTVHILDGSEKPWFPEGNLKDVSNITYHYFEPKSGEPKWQGLRARLRFAVSLPKTRFSAMFGDDDFFLISGLCAALKTLDQNDHVCSVTGLTIGFECLDKRTRWGYQNVEIRAKNLFESEDVSDRLKSHRWGEVPITYYGVFKTEIWQKTFELSHCYDFPLILFGERLVHAISLALGPMREIENPLWLRRFWVDRLNVEVPAGGRVGFGNFLSDPSNQEMVKTFLDLFTEAIQIGSPHLGVRQSSRLAKMTLIPGFRTSEVGIRRRLRRKIGKLLTKIGVVVPPSLRSTLNRKFANSITKSLGFREIRDEMKPALGRHDLEDFLKIISKAHAIEVTSEIIGVDRLLLKPREELRLRASV